MTNRLSSLLLRAPLAMLSLPLAAQAAQNAPGTAASSTASTQMLEEVVVTGIRASEERAIDIKRSAVNVVDSIAAEDLGKLPDANVAESLQRIPGVTIDRNQGDGQFVTVRGMGPQFNVVTLNGRTLATDNVGREFSFDALPSELISGADVYKSPSARINGASIGATIDIKTIRPLDQKPFAASISYDEGYAELGDLRSPRAAGLVSWHNEAGTFGVSLVGSYSDREVWTDRAMASWRLRNPSNFSGGVAPEIAPFSSLRMPIVMAQDDLTTKKRYGLDATVQWKPADNLTMTLDGFFVSLDQLQHQQQIYLGGYSGRLDRLTIENDKVVAARLTDAVIDQAVVDAPRVGDTQLVGYNIEWSNGGLQLAGDLSVSRATNNGQGRTRYTTTETPGMSYAWDTRSGSPIISITEISSSDGTPGASRTGVGAHYMDQSGTDFTDKTMEARLDGSWQGEGPVTIHFGVARNQRTKLTDSMGTPVASACYFCGGMVLNPLPESLFSLTRNDWFAGTGGNTYRQWLTWDPKALIDYLRDYTAQNPGIVGLQDPVYNPAQSSKVEEHINVGYLMITLDTELGSMPLTIDTGLRFEDTSFTSRGAGQEIISVVRNEVGNQIVTLSPVQPIGFRGKYRDILPSLNLRLDLTDRLLWRFAASRVMTRPTLTDLSPAQFISPDVGNEQIRRGNPDLQPFRASQFESGLEWYIDRSSLLSGAFFYKVIDSFVTRTTTLQQIGPATFQVTVPSNGKGATVNGFELSYRQAFTMLPAPFDGLGMQASYTYADSDAQYSNTVTNSSYGLEGLSKNTYSFVGYYEKGPLQLRLAYTRRDPFLRVAVGNAGLPAYFAEYDQLDASVTFDITENISLFASGLNLTDSKEFLYSDIRSQTLNYSQTGRRFSIGGRVRF